MKFTGRLICLMLVCLLFPAVISAEEKAKEPALPEIVVEAERPVKKQEEVTIKAEGLPAKVNIITKEDLKRMPITDYLDMFRKIPGVFVQKYTGGDFGDAIGMRGFTSGHGRQTAFFVDGMPMNTLDYCQGMADIAWVIPEMIERIEVIKGPFSALYGDFALSGVINIITKKSDPSPSLGLYGGTWDSGRAVGVLSDPSWSKSLWNATPFLVWEGYTREGYRHNQEYRRGQFFNKLTFPLWQGELSARFHYAARTWGDPGYIRIDRIKAGIISRKDAVNDSDRGDSEMVDVVLNYSPQGGEEGFHGSLFYAYHLHNTGRTFPPRPQRRRETSDHFFGWKLLYDYRPFEQLSLIVGNDLRYDKIKRHTWETWKYYLKLKQTESYDTQQSSTGFFAQGQYKPFAFLKLVGGLRFDLFQIDVDNRLFPQNSGDATYTRWSPKIGFVITPYKDINIFANYGQGFSSPACYQLSPASATRPANFDLGLTKLKTFDVGCNALLLNRLSLGFSYYNTRWNGEVWYNPATDMYESLGTSQRDGIEVEARFFLTKELTLYGSFATVRARIINPLVFGDYYIPGIPDDQSTVGFEFLKSWGGGDHQIGLDFYYMRRGRAPANKSGTLIGSQFDRYLSKLTYRYKNWTASVDAAFTPRRYASDIYTRRAGHLAITTWPLWEVLAGLKYQF